MDAVKYLKEKHRMTEYCGIECKNCELDSRNSSTNMGCVALEKNYPEKVVEIVENWSKKNPIKTYIMDLLEKYPNTKIDEDTRVPDICPSDIGFKDSPDCGKFNYSYCIKCWNQEMEG